VVGLAVVGLVVLGMIVANVIGAALGLVGGLASAAFSAGNSYGLRR
jgi:hypothetical protein